MRFPFPLAFPTVTFVVLAERPEASFERGLAIFECFVSGD